MQRIEIRLFFQRFSLATCVVASFIFLTASNAFCATHYIDCLSGLDSNNGTSQSTPWKHAPGMQGFSGTYSHSAGDHFVFKGGVVCPISYLPLVVPNGGSAGNVDMWGGLDQTWFTGGAWTRPIFDGGGTGPTLAPMIQLGANTYVTLDSVEIRNQGIPQGGFTHAVTGSGDFQTVNNIYLHGLVTIGQCINGSDSKQGGIGLDYTQPHTTLSNSTIDWTDVSPPIGGNSSAAIVFGNTFVGVTNVLVNGWVTFHDNLVHHMQYSCDTTSHGNALEVLSDTHTTIVYNNIFHDNQSGIVLLCGNLQFFNNVLYNQVGGLQIDTNCGHEATDSAFVYNNTIDGGAAGNGGAGRVIARGPTLGSLTLQNNHYILDGSGGNPICYNQSGCAPVAAITDDHEVRMTNATATAEGYVVGNSYAPASSTGLTVGVGANLTNLCGTIGVSLCSDKQGVARPASGGWDAGAYLYSGQVSTLPPTNLSAIAH